MVMVAVLSMSLYASLRVAFASQRSAEAAVEPPRTAAAALDLVGQDLQAAVPDRRCWPRSSRAPTGPTTGAAPATTCSSTPWPTAPCTPTPTATSRTIELTVITAPDGRDHLLVRQGGPQPALEHHLAQPRRRGDLPRRGRVQPAVLQRRHVGRQLGLDPGGQHDPGRRRGHADAGADRRPRARRHTYRYVRVFPLACSTAAQDSQVNPNALGGVVQ